MATKIYLKKKQINKNHIRIVWPTYLLVSRLSCWLGRSEVLRGRFTYVYFNISNILYLHIYLTYV